MAKEKSPSRKETSVSIPASARKKKKKKWPAVLLFTLIVGGTAYFFKQPILNQLKNLPLISSRFPISEQEEARTAEELELMLQEKIQKVEQLEAEVELLNQMNEVLKNKNAGLIQYEAMYTEFMKQKEAWDEEVAKTNPELFIQQFESTYPDAAKRIYSMLKEEAVLSEEQKTLARTVVEMDEEQAARVLESLLATDEALVQTILVGMSTDERAMILDGMSSKGAAKVLQLISPDEGIAK